MPGVNINWVNVGFVSVQILEHNTASNVTITAKLQETFPYLTYLLAPREKFSINDMSPPPCRA